MKIKNPCAWCGKEVQRFSSRGRAYRFCSPECDKENMAALAKIRFTKPENIDRVMRELGITNED